MISRQIDCGCLVEHGGGVASVRRVRVGVGQRLQPVGAIDRPKRMSVVEQLSAIQLRLRSALQPNPAPSLSMSRFHQRPSRPLCSLLITRAVFSITEFQVEIWQTEGMVRSIVLLLLYPSLSVELL